MDIQTIATAAGAAASGAVAGILGAHRWRGGHQEQQRLALRALDGDGTPFVRLTSADAARLERLEQLLARLIALEEQTHASLARLVDITQAARVEQAQRQGEIVGLLRQ